MPGGGFDSAELSDKEYQQFKKLIYDRSGINLGDQKKELVRARMGKRIRQLGLSSFMQYLHTVEADASGDELINMLDAISTNLTYFFREDKHFDFMRNTFLPNLVKEKSARGPRRLRIWSAGSSTGEEGYTIAMTVFMFFFGLSGGRQMPGNQKFTLPAAGAPGASAEMKKILSQWDIKIIGTDLSTKVIETAQNGIYADKRVESIDPTVLRMFFQQGENKWAGHYRVKPELRQIVDFSRLNFMERSYHFKEPFDLVFFRNVMIYFDKQTQEGLINDFYKLISPGGYLLVGHSEGLMNIKHPFKYHQPTIYKKS